MLVAATMTLVAACKSPPAEEAGGEPTSMARVEAEDHAAGADAAAHDALLLRTIMQRLSGEMAGMSHALWMEDYAEMTARAGAIADHPHMLPEEVQRIQATLGSDMAAFEAADEAVHGAAVRMHEAAAARRLDDVVAGLADVQRGCVSCHTQFRDRLRTTGR